MMSPIVIKLGGEALIETGQLAALFEVLKSVVVQRHVIVVHGGGPQVESLMAMTQCQTQKINGLRCTPAEQLPIVVGALAGYAAQQTLSAAKVAGVKAVSLSLADANLTHAKQINAQLGAVGEVTGQEPQLLNLLCGQGYLPVINSIACDDNGNTLNVNADDAAVAIAKMINADLYLLSNVKGVLDANGQLIDQLNETTFLQLSDQLVIKDGMAVKVKAALDAATSLRRCVYIASWQALEQLSQLAQTESPALGTRILF